jgi:hypothetical protein
VPLDHGQPGIDAVQEALDRARQPLRARRGGPRGGARYGPFLGVIRQEPDDPRAEHIQVSAEADEDLDAHAVALADQPQQEVSRADVVLAQRQGLPQRQL